MTNVLLISTYDLGHQPFGLASPAAWLRQNGCQVNCLDLSTQRLDETMVRQAGLVAIYLPMHTATRLAIKIIPRIRALNPRANLCCYGLYALPNASYLCELGIDTLIGGEFEANLTKLVQELQENELRTRRGQQPNGTCRTMFSTDRQQFLIPDRSMLPALNDYAQLIAPDGSSRLVGYAEASRGCKHTCRHCPIVPIYSGRFRIVQPAVVLADIQQQIAAGAEHITFGDPDFFNGPGHALRVISALHDEYPEVTYDVTIKIEHLLKYDRHLPVLRGTGCLFVTSAVEAVDNKILEKLDKGHTLEDFEVAARRLAYLGLPLIPTFVAFTPWTTAEGYLEMLSTIKRLNLIEHVPPVQYAIRLLIPASSHLLQLPEIQELIEPFDPARLCYPWHHPDPRADELYKNIYRLVRSHKPETESGRDLFLRVWHNVLETYPELKKTYSRKNIWDLASKPVPKLSESWY